MAQISRVDAAAIMFGHGSAQHKAAKKRFGPGGGPKTQKVITKKRTAKRKVK